MQAGGSILNGPPDIVTDQTSAHDPLHDYLPVGWTVAGWHAKQGSDPKAVEKVVRASMKTHVAAMVDFWNAGVPTPLFCKDNGPFRGVTLSSDPEDIYTTDQAMKELFPENEDLHNWLNMARDHISFQSLAARICWIGLGDRHKAGLKINELVAGGELKAFIIIGCDHLESDSATSRNRETEGMKDDSDATSDWLLLNALLDIAREYNLNLPGIRK